MQPLEIFLWITIWFLIAWLMFYLTLMIIEGKLYAKRKLGATAAVAIIAVVAIPLLQRVENLEPLGLLTGLAPYLAFFIVILLMKGLAAEEWSNAVIASFLGIIFLLTIRNIIYNILGIHPVWDLFV